MKKDYQTVESALRDILGEISNEFVITHYKYSFPLLEEKNIVIELCTERYQGRYSRLKVSVIHSSNGLIESTSFVFDDYFNNSNYQNRKEYYLWNGAHNSALSWYLNTPSNDNIQKLREDIKKWANIWI